MKSIEEVKPIHSQQDAPKVGPVIRPERCATMLLREAMSQQDPLKTAEPLADSHFDWTTVSPGARFLNTAGLAILQVGNDKLIRAHDGADWSGGWRLGRGREIDRDEFARLVQENRARACAESCRCFEPDGIGDDDPESSVGCDTQHGRYGDVTLTSCSDCGRKWLGYFAEYEGFRGSSRRFRGLVTDQQAAEVSAESAVALLASLPWYFASGGFVDGQWLRLTGRVQADR